MEYKIVIDFCDESFEENVPIIESPIFKTEEEADAWYRSLTFINANCDIIMLKINEKYEIVDSYLI